MNILFYRHFTKAYKKLPYKIKKQFNMRLKLFAEDPFHPLLYNHALHGEWQHFRSINVTGDIRAIYQFINNDTAEFVLIDTHTNLYS